ncbi:MAG: hypothetical protein NC485_00310 [Ruminococcus flavefaciens]|nr:hypothetical protein [Ruminococcus flavefaciens]
MKVKEYLLKAFSRSQENDNLKSVEQLYATNLSGEIRSIISTLNSQPVFLKVGLPKY